MKSKLRLAGKILSYVLLALVLVLLVMAVWARVSGTPFRIFGYSFHLVVTDSMTGEIEPHDFIVAKQVDISSVEVGKDAVVYKAESGLLAGQFIVHRVVEKYEEDGHTVLVTQGIKEGATPDPPITEIVGKYVWRSSFLGAILTFLVRPLNLIFLVVLCVLAYVAYRLIRRIIRMKDDTKSDRS